MYSDKINTVFNKMTEYERSVPKRVQHFLKVYAFAEFIAEAQGLDEHTKFILKSAALVHDIGIKPSVKKYGSSDGIYQQREGVEPAKIMLEQSGYEKADIERICYLIAHHHTYENINGIDYQILVEADFLVNIYEDMLSQEAILSIKEKIFKTKEGIRLLEEMYLTKK